MQATSDKTHPNARPNASEDRSLAVGRPGALRTLDRLSRAVGRTVGGALARRVVLYAAAIGGAFGIVLLAATRLAEIGTVLLGVLVWLAVVGLLRAHRQARLLQRRLAGIGDRIGRVERARQATDGLIGQVLAANAELATSAKKLAEAVENTRRAVVRETTTSYRELEALQNLYAMIPVAGRVPPMRGWAASPDLLLLFMETIRTERPRLVVECGSGVSTLWAGLCIRRFGLATRLVALEHDPGYAAQTSALLSAHGVADLAEVRHAPLEEFSLYGQAWRWYARNAWADLDGIGLLFVDGPPAKTGRHARFPALPLLGEHLAANAVVLLDDVARKDEQEIIERWLAVATDLVDQRLTFEKGAAVLRCPPRSLVFETDQRLLT